MSIPTEPILIIGTGLSGLCLAHALRKHDIPFRVFEKHPSMSKSHGHRFRISDEAVLGLKSLLLPRSASLLESTAPYGTVSQPRFTDTTQFQLAEPDLKDIPDSTPFDRNWILQILMLGIEEAVEFGKEFLRYEVERGDDGGQQTVKAIFADGSTAIGSLLIGADGTHSAMRRQLQPQRRLLNLNRWVIWGRSPFSRLREAHIDEALTWFIAADKERNVQILGEAIMWPTGIKDLEQFGTDEYYDYLYWAISTAPLATLPDSVHEKKEVINTLSEGWHPHIRSILDHTEFEDIACIPIISSKPDIDIRAAEQTGIVTLIGDAAHVMSPMGVAGADSAVKDAVDLAKTISLNGVTKESLLKFEERMETRAKERINFTFAGVQAIWDGDEWAEYKEANSLT
jgi:2-polyprenyl-6-methoxyphenol hydroxylase-like FAD-dependent oxidoreductase